MSKCKRESFRDYERNFGAKSYNSRVTHIEVYSSHLNRGLHRGPWRADRAFAIQWSVIVSNGSTLTAMGATLSREQAYRCFPRRGCRSYYFIIASMSEIVPVRDAINEICGRLFLARACLSARENNRFGRRLFSSRMIYRSDPLVRILYKSVRSRKSTP